MNRINSARLNERLTQLSEIGRDPAGGWSRFSFTKEYMDACALVTQWMQEAGMTVAYDAVGNLIGRKEGTDPTAAVVAMGSHIDSVQNGGMYDGNVGVIGAIEVVQTIAENGLAHKHPIEIIAFSEEEGSRFGLGLMGSKAMVGKLHKEQLYEMRDAQGKTIAEVFRDFGLDPERIDEAVKPTGYYKCYIELHIEQGSVLESNQQTIGVVEGVAGYIWLKAEIDGKANHAGATPMDLRRDALITASQVVLETEKIAKAVGPSTVATVGSMSIVPNSINVVPGHVEMTFDIRDIYPEKVEEAAARIKEYFENTCKQSDIHGEIEETIRSEGALLPKHMTDLIEQAAMKTGESYRRMISGAAHDAMMMARITDVAMIFTPSKDGRSHSPLEWTAPEELATCTQVLYNAVTEIIQ